MENWLRSLPDKAPGPGPQVGVPGPQVGVPGGMAARPGVAPQAAPAPESDPVAEYRKAALAAADVPWTFAPGGLVDFYDAAEQKNNWEMGRAGRRAEALGKSLEYANKLAMARSHQTQADAQMGQVDVERRKNEVGGSDAFQLRKIAGDIVGQNPGLVNDPRFAGMLGLPPDPLETPGTAPRFTPGATRLPLDDYLKAREMEGAAPFEIGTPAHDRLVSEYGPQIEATQDPGWWPQLANAYQGTGNEILASLGGPKLVPPLEARQARLKRMVGVRGGIPKIGFQR